MCKQAVAVSVLITAFCQSCTPVRANFPTASAIVLQDCARQELSYFGFSSLMRPVRFSWLYKNEGNQTLLLTKHMLLWLTSGTLWRRKTKQTMAERFRARLAAAAAGPVDAAAASGPFSNLLQHLRGPAQKGKRSRRAQSLGTHQNLILLMQGTKAFCLIGQRSMLYISEGCMGGRRHISGGPGHDWAIRCTCAARIPATCFC